MKNLTWQNPEQLFVAQELINKVKSKCCGIKDYKSIPQMSDDDNFNSIKVQLKLFYDEGKPFDALFQFHKGTIKTVAAPYSATSTLLFQFHKGTIKTSVSALSSPSAVISIP